MFSLRRIFFGRTPPNFKKTSQRQQEAPPFPALNLNNDLDFNNESFKRRRKKLFVMQKGKSSDNHYSSCTIILEQFDSLS